MKSQNYITIAFVGILALALVLNLGFREQETTTEGPELTRADKLSLTSTYIQINSGGKYWINPYNLDNYKGDQVKVELWRWP